MNRQTLVIAGVVLAAVAGLIIFLAVGREDETDAPPAASTSETSQPTQSESTSEPQEASPGQTVFIDDQGFSPDKLSININETVTFTNRGDSDVWPASDNHPTHTVYPELDPKKEIKPGESWSFKFTKAGTWDMHDHLNSNVTAQITVNP